MKLRIIFIISAIVLLTIPTTNISLNLEMQEMIEKPIVSGYEANEFISSYGYGEGVGGFSETNDHTETWFNDGTSWIVGDSLAIYMILIMQLPDVSTFDKIVFHADWRFTSNNADIGYWSLGDHAGDIVGAHNNLYSYTGTDSGYEEVEIALDIDADVISAQNVTGYISFIMTAAGINTYGIYCDKAFISLEYERDFFSQSVKKDTYLTPDPTQHLTSYGYGEGVGGFSETNDYTETWVNDGTSWIVGDSLAIYMILIMQLPDVSKFDKIIFHADWRFTSNNADIGYWSLGDSDGDIVAAHNDVYNYYGTDSGYEEVEIALDIDADVISAQNSTGYLSFIMTAAGINTYGIYCDWAFVSLEREYVESFSDVSDWTAWEDEDSETLTTDSDVATFTTDYTSDGAGAYDSWFTNNVSISDISGMYWEMNYEVNATEALATQLWLYEQDDHTGDSLKFGWTEFTSFDTLRKSLSDYDTQSGILTAIESIAIRIFGAVGDDIELTPDYLRISPADKMGWQHDGSTTEGVSNDGSASWDYSASSDGDILTLQYTRTATGADHWGNQRLFYDTTTTSIDIERDYYPFFEVRARITELNGISIAQCHIAPQLDGYRDSGDGVELSELNVWETLRMNLFAMSTVSTDKFIDIWCYGTDEGDTVTFEVDYVGVHSIANYTYSSSGVGTDDYLYVSEGILISNIDSGSITLDYDPTFLLNGSYSWNKSTSLGDSYLSFNHGGWETYTSNITGTLLGGTTTDFRIMFNESANIIDIQYTFIPPPPPQWHSFTMEQVYFVLPGWHLFTMEDIIFFIPINELNITYWLMLGGLVMIPTSAVLLVHGGRSEMSRDKLFLFLLMFLFGWALFLGGIL